MKIVSTSDVPLEGLRRFAAKLDPDLEPEVDQRQVFLRSVEPPSWVALLAEASWWQQVLGGAATLYVAELIKEAAKETWRNRAKTIAVAKDSVARLWELAEAIVSWRREQSALTTLGIGLPVPNQFFSTKLVLEGSNASELVAELALFAHHMPALAGLIAEHGLAKDNAATGVSLRLRNDGALLVSWHDPHTLRIQEHTLELRPGADPLVAGQARH
jgi:hypothetical protein